MDLFTYLMAKNDHNTSVNKDLFSYLLGKNQSGTYTDYSGTSLSINNTKKGKMKLSLKGNTSQYSTAGKNTFNNTLTSGSTNGITYTVNEDKSVKFSGTASVVTFITFGSWNLSGNYIFSGISNGSNSTYYLYLSGTLSNLVTITDAEKPVTNDGTSYNVVLRIGEGKTINETLYPMIRPSNTTDTYEPYTGGATPRPDFPQQIHEVSGDNEVVVCGINFWDEQWELGTFDTTTGNNNSSTTQIRSKNLIDIFSNTLYYFNNPTSSNIGYWMMFYDKEGNIITGYTPSTNNSISGNSFKCDTNKPTIVTPPNAKKMKFYLTVDYGATYNNDICINISDSDNGTYTKYEGANYPINLPVENLLDPSKILVATGQTITLIEKTRYNIKATTAGNKVIFSNMAIPTGDYTISITLVDGSYSGGNLVIQDTSKNTDGEITIGALNQKKSISISNKSIGRLILWNTPTFDGTFDIQIEKGSKSNNYVAYGTTPIELCKIGDYQDYFTKNSGKNIFDGEMEQGGRRNSDGVAFAGGTYIRSKNLTPVQPNKQYTISAVLNNSANSGDIHYLDKNKNFISRESIGLTSTKTIPNDIYYINIQYYSTNGISPNDVVRIMINEGTTAQPYEPYGTGQWCKYNAIGKVVLDGSETWISRSMTNVYGYFHPQSDIKRNSSNTTTTGYFCNYFTEVSPNQNWTTAIGNSNFAIASTSSDIIMTLGDTTDKVADFKTWLGTHNITVYYVLATPYLSLIEDNNLIEQLDNIQNAMSYKGQTNISQINNDLPFEMEAEIKVKS